MSEDMSRSEGVEKNQSTMEESIEEQTTNSGPLKHIATLGHVRSRHLDTNEIILIPTPSSDPNDPLNWSQSYKIYMATVVCLAMFMCNFLAAGPTIAIVPTAMDFFPSAAGPTLSGAISKTAFFFTTTALLQGIGNLFWMPVANKYGRRPVYIISFALYLATAFWLAFTKGYGSFLAARIVMGLAAGAAECLAPLSIADVFFLHERGTVMALYNSALSCGVAGGIIIDGLITIAHPWRYIYYVSIAIIGGLLIVVVFTFPETCYIREIDADNFRLDRSKSDVETVEGNSTMRKKSFLQQMKLFNGNYTSESLVKMIFRPLGLILLPPVLWGSLVMSVTIGFVVAITSNVASAFNTTYGFQPYQSGLCFFSAIIGSILGAFAGGNWGDKVADYFTKRNGGIREPEMRLPAIAISLITTPLALVLYGVGIQHNLHWMCPTVGLGLLNFSIVQATNISLVYTIDAYRPIAGEVTVATLCFKSCFGFLLSFYTNPWIAVDGYQNAYGTMAGIASAVLLLAIPMYFFGKKIRHVSWHWKILSFVHWDVDREVGE